MLDLPLRLLHPTLKKLSFRVNLCVVPPSSIRVGQDLNILPVKVFTHRLGQDLVPPPCPDSTQGEGTRLPKRDERDTGSLQAQTRYAPSRIPLLVGRQPICRYTDEDRKDYAISPKIQQSWVHLLRETAISPNSETFNCLNLRISPAIGFCYSWKTSLPSKLIAGVGCEVVFVETVSPMGFSAHLIFAPRNCPFPTRCRLEFCFVLNLLPSQAGVTFY